MAWKLAKGKTWKEKLEQPHPNHGKLIALPPPAQKRLGARSMLIPRPLDVDALMRRVRKGKLVTVSRIRDRLAADAGADQSCPMTTGIFIRIAAEAAEEARRAGRKRITPHLADDQAGRLIEREIPRRRQGAGRQVAARGLQVPTTRKGHEASARRGLRAASGRSVTREYGGRGARRYNGRRLSFPDGVGLLSKKRS